MKLLVKICRVLVGGLFVVSGLIKANDTLGFSYKLEEYFAESALNVPFLNDFALGLAIAACLAEIVLGFALLFGGKMKLATVSLLVLTIFFGWLTFYTATCNPEGTYTIITQSGESIENPVTCVTDCGCFGDALKGSVGRSLTPWESFTKDLILFILLIPVFIHRKIIFLNDRSADLFFLPASIIVIAFFCWVFSWWFPLLFALIAWLGYFGLKKFKGAKSDWWVAGWVASVSILFVIFCINHLPLRDYRPYAIGKNIRTQMMSAEELGLKPTSYYYDYVLTQEGTGNVKEMSSTDYMEKKIWQDKSWKITETKGPYILEKGYEIPITDFSLSTYDDDNKTEEILSHPGLLYLVVAYDAKKANSKTTTELKAFIAAALTSNEMVYGASSSSYDDVEDWRHDEQLAFPVLNGDEKVLKTIIRSNPGLVVLKDGEIIEKWAVGDIPDYNHWKSALKID